MDARLMSQSSKHELGTGSVESMRMAQAASDANKLQMWVRISLNNQCLGSRLVLLTR